MDRSTGQFPSRGSRLLVVEDECALLESLSRYLEHRGMSVERAQSVREARQHLRRARFDAYVVDLGLPDGDGRELVEPDRAPRTLVISADPRPRGLAELGICHFLAKPLDLARVACIVAGFPCERADGPSSKEATGCSFERSRG